MALTKVIGDGLGGTNDLTVDTDTLIVDSTNDNVGINVASPNNYYSKELVVGVPDNGGITILNSGTTHAGCIMFADGTGTSAYRGQIVYDHNDDSIGIWTAAVNAMRIDSTGAMTKQNQPAFQVNPASNQLNLADSDVLVFGQEKFDQNSDFASNTFTAPVTGKYQLQLTARIDQIDTDANWVRIEMVTSNREYQTSIFDPDAFDKDPDYWSINFGVLADMDAGDTVFLRWGQSGGSNTADFDSQAHFSGYLVA